MSKGFKRFPWAGRVIMKRQRAAQLMLEAAKRSRQRKDFTGAARGERCAGAFLNRESQGGLMCVQQQDSPTWLLSASAMAH